jgi:hypothetical protein
MSEWAWLLVSLEIWKRLRGRDRRNGRKELVELGWVGSDWAGLRKELRKELDERLREQEWCGR